YRDRSNGLVDDLPGDTAGEGAEARKVLSRPRCFALTYPGNILCLHPNSPDTLYGMKLHTWLIIGLILSLLGCQPNAPADSQISKPAEPELPPWFADVTDELGLNFVHDPGRTGTYFMPQIMGSG